MKNLFYLLFILPLMYSCGGNSGPSELEASVVIQDFVKEKLKSPSTAEFEPGIVNAVRKVEENTYEASSYVDSQNSFGATVRTNFKCRVKWKSEYTWSLVSLEMD